MTITVSELLQIPYFSSTTLVASEGGSNKRIRTAALLDYEYSRSYEMKKQVFLKDDLLVSSLMFAQNDPEALEDALRELIDLGAAALVYKPVFYDTLPESVLSMAEGNDFPILRADPSLNMEDYIYHVIDNLQLIRRQETLSTILDDLIWNRTSRAGLPDAADTLIPNHRSFVYAAYLKPADTGQTLSPMNLYNGTGVLKKVSGAISICRYEDGIFLLLSDRFSEEQKYANRMEDVLAYLGLSKEELFVGAGEVCACPDEIDLAVQQAHNANMSARILGQSWLSFKETGVFQILIPHARSAHMLHFMKKYLAPLLESTEEKHAELLRTAITFVLSGSDAGACAERLFCHKNTVRYRMSSLHDLLDPNAGEATFNERLGIAVKIYLIQQMDGETAWKAEKG